MRWLLASGDFTPLGGMDRANHALAFSLAGRGDDVTLVTHRAWPDVQPPAVRVRLVPRPLGSHVLGAPLLAKAAGAAARRAGSAMRVVVNGGNADTDDVSWVHYLHAAHRGDVRVTGRRLWFKAARQYFLARERRVLRRAQFVVCNSRRTAEDAARAYDIPAARLRVVYYGVDAAQFSRVDPEARAAARHALGWPEQGHVALFVGALGDRRKGFDRLFEAWQILARDAQWDVTLTVAGAGGELAEWQARAAQAGLTSMRFMGFRTDIALLMAASDVVVHPSRYEAYGLGVHEAICRGLPAIVTASAGVAEQYGPELGRLLIQDPESAAEIADRLRGWRSALDENTRLVAPLSDRLRKRGWTAMSEDFVRAVTP